MRSHGFSGKEGGGISRRQQSKKGGGESGL